RSVRDWKASNPLGYIAWFDSRARPYYTLLEARMAPLPSYAPGDAGDPLRRTVQLMKRHRDIRFDGNPDNAPRSVVLTTLAAKHYQGQESVGQALIGALMGIRSEIANTNGILTVPNPTNPEENFADAWQGNRQAYNEFIAYVDQFASDLHGLF